MIYELLFKIMLQEIEQIKNWHNIYKHIVLILSAPFMSPLSEKVENHLLGKSTTINFSISQMLKDLLRGIRIALRNIIREIFYTILLLLLGLIPFFSPFAPFLILAVQSFYAGSVSYTHLTLPTICSV